MGFSHAHPCFFEHLVSRESGAKLCYLLPSWDVSFSFHDEVKDGIFYGSRDMWTTKGGLSLRGDEDFSWRFRIRGSSMQVGRQQRRSS
jgi:hypothetical protein